MLRDKSTITTKAIIRTTPVDIKPGVGAGYGPARATHGVAPTVGNFLLDNRSRHVPVKSLSSLFGLLAAVSLCSSFMMSKPALAVPGTDYFATTTKPPSQVKSQSNKNISPSHPPEAFGSLAMMSHGSPVVTWFEALDDRIQSLKPTQADRVILNRPFNREKERVEQWIQVARKIAKNYRLCSQTLKGMPVPNNAQGLKEYRDLTADWYLDVATVYEDLIKPRPAARTMEELEDALNEVKGRAQSLTKTSTSLKAMDISLRKQYSVHLARHDDALQQYVRGK